MSPSTADSAGFTRPKSRPKTRGHLEQLVDQYSRAEGLVPGRTRRWISTLALLGALERLEHEGAPVFIVKGGTAMELRFRLRARATKDVDLVFRDGREGDEDAVERALADTLDDAFEDPYCGFTFRRKGEPEAIRNTASHRLDVALDFAGRAWQTVQIEVSRPEGGLAESELVEAAISLEDFVLEAPQTVAVLSLRFQIAQKLHAVTEQPQDHENDRARDLIDLQLLEALTEDLAPVRAACVEIFEQRGKQPWPPELIVQPGWDRLYERLARDLDSPVSDVEEAAKRVRAFIAAIDAATT
jgi:hypothetical protein